MVQSFTGFICLIVLSYFTDDRCDFWDLSLYYTIVMGGVGFLSLVTCFFFDFKEVETIE